VRSENLLENYKNEFKSNLGAYKSAWGVGGGRGRGRKDKEGEGFGWRKGGRWKEGVVVEGWVSFFLGNTGYSTSLE
jgi:hypothetical protein